MYFKNGERLNFCKKTPQNVSHSPRRNIISGMKKWIGVQNGERERKKKDSSHFETFFTCEAVVRNPLCLTIFHLHCRVKNKQTGICCSFP